MEFSIQADRRLLEPALHSLETALTPPLLLPQLPRQNCRWGRPRPPEAPHCCLEPPTRRQPPEMPFKPSPISSLLSTSVKLTTPPLVWYGIIGGCTMGRTENNTEKIAISSFTVPRVSGVSERANGRASGLVFTSGFLVYLVHSGMELWWLY